MITHIDTSVCAYGNQNSSGKDVEIQKKRPQNSDSTKFFVQHEPRASWFLVGIAKLWRRCNFSTGWFHNRQWSSLLYKLWCHKGHKLDINVGYFDYGWDTAYSSWGMAQMLKVVRFLQANDTNATPWYEAPKTKGENWYTLLLLLLLMMMMMMLLMISLSLLSVVITGSFFDLLPQHPTTPCPTVLVVTAGVFRVLPLVQEIWSKSICQSEWMRLGNPAKTKRQTDKASKSYQVFMLG